jgi:hypothetical protein
MTAYSTAVGPSSLSRKSITQMAASFIENTPLAIP